MTDIVRPSKKRTSTSSGAPMWKKSNSQKANLFNSLSPSKPLLVSNFPHTRRSRSRRKYAQSVRKTLIGPWVSFKTARPNSRRLSVALKKMTTPFLITRVNVMANPSLKRPPRRPASKRKTISGSTCMKVTSYPVFMNHSSASRPESRKTSHSQPLRTLSLKSWPARNFPLT